MADEYGGCGHGKRTAASAGTSCQFGLLEVRAGVYVGDTEVAWEMIWQQITQLMESERSNGLGNKY